VSLVTKCVSGDFQQLTFNDVVRGRGGQKVLSKPSADSFAVGRRQKICCCFDGHVTVLSNIEQDPLKQGIQKSSEI
jgi:hypothetical protein